MKKSERIVLFYDLIINAKSRNFEAPKGISVRYFFELIEKIPMKMRMKDVSKGREHLYISDWNWKGDVITILFNKSDKEISDPVFTVPEEGKRRTAAKSEKEGQDYSAHALITLPKNENEPALFLVEQCAGLSVNVIKKLLDHLIRNAKDISPDAFEQVHPDGAIGTDGKPKKYNVNYHCEFQGHISDDLIYDLNHGKIHSIELITEREKFTHFDQDGYIVEKCKTVVLTVEDQKMKIKDRFKAIKNVVTGKKDDYSLARIKFKSPEGIERSVEMETSDLSTSGYVKKAKLDGFDTELQSSYDKLFGPIVGKMEAILKEQAPQ